MPVIAGGINAETVRFSGVDLKATYGVYAEVMDGVASPPPVRGQNLLIPYQRGMRWVQKFYGERSIVITGSMINVVSRADFYAKLDGLKQLLQIGTGEKVLEVQQQDGTFRYVMAEVRNTMGLQWLTFPTRSSTFSIEFVASDPIWYSSALAAGGNSAPWTFDSGISFDDGFHWFNQIGVLFTQTLVARQTMVACRNAGSTYTRKPIFTLNGVYMIGPKITNLTNGYSVQVLGRFGGALVIDCGAQTAGIPAPLPATQIVLGAGQTDWMRLEAGDNNLLVDLGETADQAVYSVSFSNSYL